MRISVTVDWDAPPVARILPSLPGLLGQAPMVQVWTPTPNVPPPPRRAPKGGRRQGHPCKRPATRRAHFIASSVPQRSPDEGGTRDTSITQGMEATSRLTQLSSRSAQAQPILRLSPSWSQPQSWSPELVPRAGQPTDVTRHHSALSLECHEDLWIAGSRVWGSVDGWFTSVRVCSGRDADTRFV
jgi:hypothetical protein